MIIKNTQGWFQAAVPEPDSKSLCVQLGCHFEEVAEMIETLDILDGDGSPSLRNAALDALESQADAMKHGQCSVFDVEGKPMLDALCDQIVTAVGVGYMLGFDMEGALNEVMRSNYSKFENGKPVFNEQGKIAKGRDYTSPNLEPYL